MCQGGDGLHLDGVSLLQGVVEDPGCVHHLPAQVPIVQVTHKQRLCREGVRLHFHVGARDLVDEAGLADVGKAAYEDGTSVGIDGRQPGQVLPNLFQVLEALLLPLHDGAHAPQCGALELLAAVHGVGKLDQPNIVLRHVVYEVLSGVDLTQGQLVVVLVVQDVHEVPVEGVYVVQLRELGYDGGQLVVVVLLGELDLARVELADPADLVVAMDHGWSLALCLRQDDVDEVLRRRDHSYGLEVVMRHL